MSMERMGELRPEDQEAAFALLNEHPLLSNDAYAKKVVEEGRSASGVEMDLGNFLSARAAVLEMEAAKEKLTNLKNIDPSAVEVAYGVAPDKEKNIEGGK